MIFICDNQRHLVCYPYSVENLHLMASKLNIKKCWFHPSPKHKHYDIPKKRIDEIKSKCNLVVSPRELLSVINNNITKELQEKINNELLKSTMVL